MFADPSAQAARLSFAGMDDRDPARPRAYESARSEADHHQKRVWQGFATMITVDLGDLVVIPNAGGLVACGGANVQICADLA